MPTSVAGSFLAGVEDPGPTDRSFTQLAPTGTHFDPETHAYRFDELGRVAGLHPVDHQVALIIGLEAGSVPAASDVGNSFRKSLGGVALHQRASVGELAVREALGQLVSNQDIRIDSISVDSPKRDVITIRYTNLRQGRSVTIFG